MIPHIFLKIGLIGLGHEGEQPIVRDWGYDFVKVFGEDDTLTFWKNLFIVL